MVILAPLKKNIDSVIAAVIGFIFIQVLTKHSGIGISPDTIVYLSTARNLLAGRGWIDFSGSPLINFPLFYPTFLSTFSCITGKDILSTAPFLNSFLFAAVIYLSGTIIEHFINTAKWYKWIILSIITFSPSLFEVYSMLWSETLFILLTIIFFISLRSYLKQPSYKNLLFVSVISAVAFVTRYAGITLLATGVLLMLLEFSIGRRKKLIHILLFGIIGISLISLNLIRNFFQTKTLAGSRLKGNTPFSQNLNYFGTVMCDWFSFLKDHYSFASVLGIIILIISIVTFFLHSINKQYSYSYEKILPAFFTVYSLFIILSSTISRYETINNRLLSPAYIPFIAGISYHLPYWQKNISKKLWQISYAIGICILFIGFQYYQYKTNAKNYEDIKDDGIPGYAEDIWKNSPVVQFIQKDTLLAKHASQTFCNQNHAVYLFTGYSVTSIPERAHLKEVEQFHHYSNYYIIWFFTDENPDLLSISEIKQHAYLTLVHQFSDGVIFYCENNK